MRYLKTIKQVLAAVAEPLRRNCTFAVFMYLLGCITAWATLPNVRGAHLYDNLYLELFLDVYVLTLILTLLPRKVMIWVRGSSTLCYTPQQWWMSTLREVSVDTYPDDAATRR